MKVKATPSDFQVKEESLLAPGGRRSTFAIFHLSKSSWDTFDLIDLLARRWGVQRQDVSVGGMKDRHGSTEQTISVRWRGGRPVSITEKNFTVVFEGWADAPVTARDVRGNTFTITLRDLTVREAETIAANSLDVSRDGIPNYFDSQRFGSARHGAGFMGKEIFLGRRERALRLYFTPSKHDDQKTRTLKRCVIENWGRWEKCASLGFGEYGRILAYLAQNRGAFHQALERIDRRFLVFVLNAYQSFLFNELLARWLAETAAETGAALVDLRYAFGVYKFYGPLGQAAAERLRTTLLPVPGYDTACGDARVARMLEEVLAAEGIGLSDLRVRQMHRIRVGGVERAACVVPEGMEVSAPADDEMYPERKKVTLSFFLPRGAYATLVIKRLALPPAR